MGAFHYYSKATVPLPLVGLGTIASEQSHGNETMLNAAHRYLDYLATFPKVTIAYEKSYMVLWVHSDGAYLVDRMLTAEQGGITSSATSSKI